jgi:hypothetical protein
LDREVLKLVYLDLDVQLLKTPENFLRAGTEDGDFELVV